MKLRAATDGRARRLLLWAWLGSAMGALTPACGAPWQLVRQTGPNPFASAEHRFVVRSISFESMRVRGHSRADYFAHDPPSELARFDGDMAAMSERLADALHDNSALVADVVYAPDATTDAPGFVIQPRIVELDPGSYGGLLGRSTDVRMLVQIARPDGTILDEIVLHASAEASMETAAAGTRLRHCADALAADLARYLQTRLRG